MKKMLIKIFVVFIVLTTTPISFLLCQNTKIDSLKKELIHQKQDTNQCRILLEIGDHYKNNNPDSSLIYYNKCLKLAISKKIALQQANALRSLGNIYSDRSNYNIALDYYSQSLEITKKLDDQKGLSSCYNNIAIVWTNQGNYEKAIEYFKKALSIDLALKDNAGVSLLYNNIAIINRLQGNYTQAEEYLNNALKLAEDLGDKKGISRCYTNLGNINSNQGNYSKAIDFHIKSLKIDSVLDYKKGMANCYGNIAIIYYHQGNYTNAIDNFAKSLLIFNELGDKNGVSACHNNMGLVYQNQGKYEEAIECYLQSLKLSEESGIKEGIANSYDNVGNVYHEQGNYEKAVEYHNKSLQIKEEIGDKKGISSSYNNIGNVFHSQGNQSRAIEYYQKSLKIQEEINDKRGMSFNYHNIGNILTQQGNYSKAIEYYHKSLQIKNEIGDKQGLASTNISLANLYSCLSDSVQGVEREKYLRNAIVSGKKGYTIAVEIGATPKQNDAAAALQRANKSIGNIKDALKYAEIFIATRDSMFREEKTKAITEMQTKYETEKKQQEIEKQQLVIEKQEIDNRRQRNQRNFFIAGTFLLALLALVVFRSYQQKKRSNEIITEKNVLLEQANEEIAAQRDLVMEQKEHIEKIHEEVTSSIRYASRIQEAVLPAQVQMAELLGNHFVLFKPKDIVSGDFFWATRVRTHSQAYPTVDSHSSNEKVLPLGEDLGGAELLIFCVADCTGHGVPGAFMSMLGVSFLNDIVHKEQVTSAAEVLNHLRDSVIAALKQKGEGGEQKDGMDMGLCVIDTETKRMQFAGGYNPCWIVPNPEFANERLIEPKSDDESTNNCAVIQLKPDKMPIAIHKHMEPYTNQTAQLYSGDQVYLMSDGFQDQFGGEHGKKFMVKNLRELVVSNAALPMDQQREALEKSLEDWKGEAEQVDDVTILGVKF